jgi:hypothetical protein
MPALLSVENYVPLKPVHRDETFVFQFDENVKRNDLQESKKFKVGPKVLSW